MHQRAFPYVLHPLYMYEEIRATAGIQASIASVQAQPSSVPRPRMVLVAWTQLECWEPLAVSAFSAYPASPLILRAHQQGPLHHAECRLHRSRVVLLSRQRYTQLAQTLAITGRANPKAPSAA